MGFKKTGPPSDGPAGRLNLLLIAVDTLSADHLGAYGYERPTSPRIDRFFGEAIVFDDAHTTSSWTLPSSASLMTSTHSSTHKCWQFDSQLDPSFTTLAEVLHDAGYHTAAVTSHSFLRKNYGLAQGFEDYGESLIFGLKQNHRAISSPRSPNGRSRSSTVRRTWRNDAPGFSGFTTSIRTMSTPSPSGYGSHGPWGGVGHALEVRVGCEHLAGPTPGPRGQPGNAVLAEPWRELLVRARKRLLLRGGGDRLGGDSSTPGHGAWRRAWGASARGRLPPPRPCLPLPGPAALSRTRSYRSSRCSRHWRSLVPAASGP